MPTAPVNEYMEPDTGSEAEDVVEVPETTEATNAEPLLAVAEEGAVVEEADEATPEDVVPVVTRSTANAEARERAKQLFFRLAELEEGSTERSKLRDDLVRLHLPLVQYLARRFRNRGEAYEDLVQVGTIGLLKAVDRFDPERGLEFSTYATPTITGEIKRHFRDKGWAVRVPRRLQELKLSLGKATNDLSQALGRSPTVPELAKHMNLTDEEVLEGLESANAYATVPLDAPVREEEDSPSVVSSLGEVDVAIEAIEQRESLKPLLALLPEREKRILLLRFFQHKTQSQIAQELGISQMHVSRLLARTLAKLREDLTRED